MFACNSCIPPYSYIANGEWQKVDRPGIDAVRLEVVDASTVRSAARFKGRDMGRATWIVSEDGQSLTQVFVNLDADEPTEGTVKLTRKSDAPAGAHALSGTWSLAGYGKISAAALRTTYSLTGDTLTVTYNGGSWSAVLGGQPARIEGSESGTLVTAERIGDNRYRETYFRKEKIVGLTEITVKGDNMTVVATDPRDDSLLRYEAWRE
ncbi:hypothetical protein MACH05_13010 [Qipengyuania nanhaisediminis]